MIEIKNKPMQIISLGAGVQSSTLSLMAARGEITPMPDAAIFSDTKAEPKAVYEWLGWLEKQLPFPVYRVSKGDLAADGLVVHTSKKSGKTYIKSLIPAFTLQPDGKRGLLGRKCTADYKVKAIISKIRELVTDSAIGEWRKKHKEASRALSKWDSENTIIKAFNKGKPKSERKMFLMRPDWAWEECQSDALAVSWIGISYDESHRMKDSKVSWIRNEWQLVTRALTRDACIRWMAKNGFPEPPRSACRFCPFHSDDEWIRLRDNEPEEFDMAVEYEKKLQDSASRQVALTGIPFLHGDCIALDKVKFIPTKKGFRQISLFGNECEGMCGV